MPDTPPSSTTTASGATSSHPQAGETPEKLFTPEEDQMLTELLANSFRHIHDSSRIYRDMDEKQDRLNALVGVRSEFGRDVKLTPNTANLERYIQTLKTEIDTKRKQVENQKQNAIQAFKNFAEQAITIGLKEIPQLKDYLKDAFKQYSDVVMTGNQRDFDRLEKEIATVKAEKLSVSEKDGLLASFDEFKKQVETLQKTRMENAEKQLGAQISNVRQELEKINDQHIQKLAVRACERSMGTLTRGLGYCDTKYVKDTVNQALKDNDEKTQRLLLAERSAFLFRVNELQQMVNRQMSSEKLQQMMTNLPQLQNLKQSLDAMANTVVSLQSQTNHSKNHAAEGDAAKSVVELQKQVNDLFSRVNNMDDLKKSMNDFSARVGNAEELKKSMNDLSARVDNMAELTKLIKDLSARVHNMTEMQSHPEKATRLSEQVQLTEPGQRSAETDTRLSNMQSKQLEELTHQMKVFKNKCNAVDHFSRVKLGELQKQIEDLNARSSQGSFTSMDLNRKRPRADDASIQTIQEQLATLETQHRQLVDFIYQFRTNVLSLKFPSRLESCILHIEDILSSHEQFIAFLVNPLVASEGQQKVALPAAPKSDEENTQLSPTVIHAIQDLVKKSTEQATEPLLKKIRTLEEKLAQQT
ncbi:uncharacterized protein BYT42DRAFT_574913 [Radiomyces spectabilis]|uniref:uncharacterized protein n=1 Tax=Radiomyces spectabilis TaxID=64574 RepID=UPI002220F070|nr:uncharacterized protein BYT42DRAFT_574913 [Radiomyces spectabilis]KAI8376521.1 hypothetical protein BYT42DRAFT_574913 [Radiomyces spectabilis]